MFNIIRGIQSVVDNTPIVDGQMLFTTDTDKIYIDNGTTRIMYRGVPIDSTLSTTSTNVVENQAITNNCGMASNLQTTIKTNIVSAVNELNSNVGRYLGSSTIDSGSITTTIDNSTITTNSLIDIYYAESSKETVQDATPSYAQTKGTLTITFESALASDVTISNIKVVNP